MSDSDDASKAAVKALNATVYIALMKNGRYRVRIVDDETGKESWSEQDYATKEEAQSEFDKLMVELDI